MTFGKFASLGTISCAVETVTNFLFVQHGNGTSERLLILWMEYRAKTFIGTEFALWDDVPIDDSGRTFVLLLFCFLLFLLRSLHFGFSIRIVVGPVVGFSFLHFLVWNVKRTELDVTKDAGKVQGVVFDQVEIVMGAGFKVSLNTNMYLKKEFLTKNFRVLIKIFFKFSFKRIDLFV